MAQHSLLDYGLLIIQASRSFSDIPQSAEHPCTRDQPDAETSTQQPTITHYSNFHATAWFELVFTASRREQTHFFDHVDTGIGVYIPSVKLHVFYSTPRNEHSLQTKVQSYLLGKCPFKFHKHKELTNVFTLNKHFY